ncbi:hypothetical protein [Pirellulimonas nuda]|nr:hypothetical protein [Pirellulimonas nuda]
MIVSSCRYPNADPSPEARAETLVTTKEPWFKAMLVGQEVRDFVTGLLNACGVSAKNDALLLAIATAAAKDVVDAELGDPTEPLAEEGSAQDGVSVPPERNPRHLLIEIVQNAAGPEAQLKLLRHFLRSAMWAAATLSEDGPYAN